MSCSRKSACVKALNFFFAARFVVEVKFVSEFVIFVFFFKLFLYELCDVVFVLVVRCMVVVWICISIFTSRLYVSFDVKGLSSSLNVILRVLCKDEYLFVLGLLM